MERKKSDLNKKKCFMENLRNTAREGDAWRDFKFDLVFVI